MSYKVTVVGKGYADLDDAMFRHLVLPGNLVKTGKEVYRLTGGGAIKIDPERKKETGTIQPRDSVFHDKEWSVELSSEEIEKQICRQ